MNLKHYINFLGIKPLKKVFSVFNANLFNNHAHPHACTTFHLLNMTKKLTAFLKE